MFRLSHVVDVIFCSHDGQETHPHEDDSFNKRKWIAMSITFPSSTVMISSFVKLCGQGGPLASASLYLAVSLE
jgi:hypothetical protein